MNLSIETGLNLPNTELLLAFDDARIDELAVRECLAVDGETFVDYVFGDHSVFDEHDGDEEPEPASRMYEQWVRERALDQARDFVHH